MYLCVYAWNHVNEGYLVFSCTYLLPLILTTKLWWPQYCAVANCCDWLGNLCELAFRIVSPSSCTFELSLVHLFTKLFSIRPVEHVVFFFFFFFKNVNRYDKILLEMGFVNLLVCGFWKSCDLFFFSNEAFSPTNGETISLPSWCDSKNLATSVWRLKCECVILWDPDVIIWVA